MSGLLEIGLAQLSYNNTCHNHIEVVKGLLRRRAAALLTPGGVPLAVRGDYRAFGGWVRVM